MTSTAHALVAGAIATNIASPFQAYSLALVSHYIMDSIPHWDFGTNWRSRPKRHTGALAITETLFGIGISYVIFGMHTSTIHWMLAVAFALLPDWLEVPWYIFYAHQTKHQPGKNAAFLERLAYAFYKLPNIFHAKATFPFGLITQFVTVLFFWLLVS